LVPQLFWKVQFGTRTLGMVNLVSKLFKRVYFGTFRYRLHNTICLLLRWHCARHTLQKKWFGTWFLW